MIKQSKKAYTLIELLVSISIVSILISLGFSSYKKAQEKEIIESASKKIESIFNEYFLRKNNLAT